MKLSLIVTLHLALLASAAPTPFFRKRDNAEEVTPDFSSKIAYGSLKSAAELMNSYNDENLDTKKADMGNNMPITMTPNGKADFPGADGKIQDATQKGKHPKPTPKASGTSTDQGEEDQEQEEEEEKKVAAVRKPSPSSAAIPSSSSSAVRPGSPEDEDDDAEPELKKAPKSASSPAKPKEKDNNPLSSLPVLGGVLGGLGGGVI